MARPLFLSRTAAGLLLLATVVFVIGVTAEGMPEPASRGLSPAATAVRTGESPEQVACERSGGRETDCAQLPSAERNATEQHGEGTPSQEAAERAAGVGEPVILGVPLESPVAIMAVVLISLVIAALVWLMPATTWPLFVIVVFALASGVLDVREIPIQVDRARNALVAVAALAAILHFGSAAAAAAALLRLRAINLTPDAVTLSDIRGQHAR
jgi:hypothetical protein